MTGGPAGGSKGWPAPWTWLAWVPIAAYSGLIFYLSSRTFAALDRWQALSFDKLLHLGAFGGWAVLLGVALLGTWPRIATRSLVLIIVLSGSIYGASDEIHQGFVPGRVFDPWDWVADTLGVLAGACLVVRVRALRGFRRARKQEDPSGTEDRE